MKKLLYLHIVCSYLIATHVSGKTDRYFLQCTKQCILQYEQVEEPNYPAIHGCPTLLPPNVWLQSKRQYSEMERRGNLWASSDHKANAARENAEPGDPDDLSDFSDKSRKIIRRAMPHFESKNLFDDPSDIMNMDPQRLDVKIQIMECVKIHINLRLGYVAIVVVDVMYLASWSSDIQGIFTCNGYGIIADWCLNNVTTVKVELPRLRPGQTFSDNIHNILIATKRLNYRDFVGSLDVFLAEVYSYAGDKYFNINAMVTFRDAPYLRNNLIPFEKMLRKRMNPMFAVYGLLGIFLNWLDVSMYEQKQFKILVLALTYGIDDLQFYKDWILSFCSHPRIHVDVLYLIVMSMQYIPNYQDACQRIEYKEVQCIVRDLYIEGRLHVFTFIKGIRDLYVMSISYGHYAVERRYGIVRGPNFFGIINFKTGFAFLIPGQGYFIYVNLHVGLYYIIDGTTYEAYFSPEPCEEIYKPFIDGFIDVSIQNCINICAYNKERQFKFFDEINYIVSYETNRLDQMKQQFWQHILIDLHEASSNGLAGFQLIVGQICHYGQKPDKLAILFVDLSVALYKVRGCTMPGLVKQIICGFEAFVNGDQNIIQLIIKRIINFEFSLTNFEANIPVLVVNITNSVAIGPNEPLPFEIIDTVGTQMAQPRNYKDYCPNGTLLVSELPPV